MSVLGIQTILAATDLTAAMVPALRSAAQLARLTDARLHIVHTTESRADESSLTRHLEEAGITAAESEADILIGPPGALITEEAARIGADVIILGPHRPERTSLGSTAYRVVYGARIPCLMLPVPLPLPLREVLVPLDTSEAPHGALAAALTWASALRRRQADGASTRVTALHVAGGHDENAGQTLQGEVDRVVNRFGGAARVTVETAVVAGEPAPLILQHAQSGNFDMIVMPTRGRRPREAAIGSVSLNVVMSSRFPVLLVPPDVWRDG